MGPSSFLATICCVPAVRRNNLARNMPDQYGNPTEAELRGQRVEPSLAMGSSGYTPPSKADLKARAAAAKSVVAGKTPGYFNGNVFAGTNGQPMSDAAYALVSNNGTQAIAKDRDVNGTGGVGKSLASAGKFELDHVGNIFEGLADQPARLVFGFDPIGQKASNLVSGEERDPLVNQMGGATSKEIRQYEAEHGTNSAGAAQNLHDAAAGTAAVVAAGTYLRGGLAGGSNPGGVATQPYRGVYNGGQQVAQASEPVVGFGGAGTGGIPADLAADFAGTQFGVGGNGLVLAGGAGTGVPAWLNSAGRYVKNVKDVYDLASGVAGAGQQGAPPPSGSASDVNSPNNPARLSLMLSPRMRARLAARPHNMGARIAARNSSMGVGP